MAPDTLVKYSAMQASQLVGQDRPEDAVMVLAAHPVDAHSSLELLKCTVRATLGRAKDAVSSDEHGRAVEVLRNLLLDLKRNESRHARGGPLEAMLLATHLTHVVSTLGKLKPSRDVLELKAKAAVGLLRYPALVPADKLFLVAGLACREAGFANLACVLLNRYLDLAEAIDESDASLLDNADLAAATALSFPDTIPTNQYLQDEVKCAPCASWNPPGAFYGLVLFLLSSLSWIHEGCARGGSGLGSQRLHGQLSRPGAAS